MRQSTDIRELALLGLCDRLGRKNADKGQARADIRLFLQKCGRGEAIADYE